MEKIDKLKLKENDSIKEALKVIDNAAMQIALVVDENDKLIGTLTDGDIRRGLLKGLDLNSSIKSIVNRNSLTAKITDTKEEILQKAFAKKIHKIPIIDENGKLLEIEEIEELIKPKEKSNKVILMVGGLGTRLRPLTENIPKPMLKIGNKRTFRACSHYKKRRCERYFT
jgi:CBS domain-containing protein